MLHDVLVTLPAIITALAALVVAIRGNRQSKVAHKATKAQVARLQVRVSDLEPENTRGQGYQDGMGMHRPPPSDLP